MFAGAERRVLARNGLLDAHARHGQLQPAVAKPAGIEMRAIPMAHSGPIAADSRSRAESWAVLPQGLRGITLGELKDFYNSNKSWIEEELWRCSSCNQCFPCAGCPNCGMTDGSVESRNLYEVNKEMIMPRCAAERVSYVEWLARHTRQARSECRVPVQTFVSHWWGEEFPKFMASLERYAKLRARQAESKRWVISLAAVALAGAVIPPFILLLNTGWSRARMRRFGLNIAKVTNAALFDFLVRIIFLLLATIRRLSTEHVEQKSLNHSFWICAFCNNQYAIDHALGVKGDVYTTSFAQALQAETCHDMVAIFDRTGELYNRVWCVFEFFMVKEILPKRRGRNLSIYMANERGVISEGDATDDVIRDVRNAISKIDTAQSRASVMKDKVMIEEHLVRMGTTHDQLDGMLRQLAEDALHAAGLRKFLPFVTFSIGPLLGVLLTEFVHASLNALLRRKWRGLHLPWKVVYMPAKYVAVVSLFLFLLCVGAIELFLRQARANQQSWRVRLFGGSFMMAAPGIFYALSQIIVRIFFAQGAWLSYFVTCSRNICAVCQILVSCTGLTLGLLYAALRDREFFSPARQWIEDMAFT